MRKEQTKTQSFIEQITSRVLGFTVAVITGQLFVYGMFGVAVSGTQNLGMMAYFTCQGIFVGYLSRRFFEYLGK